MRAPGKSSQNVAVNHLEPINLVPTWKSRPEQFRFAKMMFALVAKKSRAEYRSDEQRTVQLKINQGYQF